MIIEIHAQFLGRNPFAITKVLVFHLCAFSLIVLAHAHPPNQWRGPNRDGIFPEGNLLEQWPDGGPNLLWVFQGLGQGFSSATVTADHVYVTGLIGKNGVLSCLDLAGKLRWKQEYGPEWSGSYPGARSTPTIVGDRLFLLSGLGIAVCLERMTGREIWKFDMCRRFAARVPYFGFAESPLFFEGKVVFSPCGPKHNVVLLDQNTGETIWTSRAGAEEHAYCSPVLFHHHGEKIIASATEKSIFALDAENGHLLWAFPHKAREPDHGNSPIYHEGKLLCVGSQSDGIMLQLSNDGHHVSELWRNPKLESQWGGAVIIGDRIFASGSSHRKSQQWMCIDAGTGKQKFASRKIGHGIVFHADDHLYWYSHRGELALVKPNENGFDVVGRTKITHGSEQHFAHPTIRDGILYVRHGNALLAFDLRRDPSPDA